MIIYEIKKTTSNSGFGYEIKAGSYLEKDRIYTLKFKCGFGFWLNSFIEHLKKCIGDICQVLGVEEKGVFWWKHTYITLIPYQRIQLKELLAILSSCIDEFRQKSIFLKYAEPCVFEGIVQGTVVKMEVKETKQAVESSFVLNIVSNIGKSVLKYGVIAIVGAIATKTMINKLFQKIERKPLPPPKQALPESNKNVEVKNDNR